MKQLINTHSGHVGHKLYCTLRVGHFLVTAKLARVSSVCLFCGVIHSVTKLITN